MGKRTTAALLAAAVVGGILAARWMMDAERSAGPRLAPSAPGKAPDAKPLPGAAARGEAHPSVVSGEIPSVGPAAAGDPVAPRPLPEAKATGAAGEGGSGACEGAAPKEAAPAAPREMAKTPEDYWKRRFMDLGISADESRVLWERLAEERRAVALRFREDFSREDWLRYREARNLPAHRQGGEAMESWSRLYKRFQAVQEEVLSQYDGLYSHLDPQIRTQVDRFRGGCLGIGEDGEPDVMGPVVSSIPLGPH